jgi:type I restriction enzyme R subunit
MNFWLHRISHHAEASYPLLEKGFLTIGYSDFISSEFLEKTKSKDWAYFENAFAEEWGSNPRTRHNLWRFVAEMQVGDWVLVPSWGSFSIYQIDGEACLINSIEAQGLEAWNNRLLTVMPDGLRISDQPICRTNRTFGQEKTHGLIVDYIGIFDDVAQALDFDEKAVQQVVSNIEELRKALPVQVQKCLAFFPHVDRSVGGYEGLMAAQQCLPNNEVRDKFAANYIVLGTIWEALSPDPCLSPYEKDYRWLTAVYESVKPVSGNGKLLWHALGAKTVELINQNVHLESVRDDVETLVLDAQVLEEILADADPAKRGREIEITLIARLRKHLGNPKFTALGERLEKIKERHEQGFLNSLQFLKEILEVAKEVLEAEKQADPQEERDRAKEALTELFKDAKTKNTHIIVERIVADIDDIVKKVRFPDWQRTNAGERLVQKELRRTLLKYKLHTDQELFDKAYGYIRQYY